MPRRCVFCGTRCKCFEAYICEGCISDIPWCEQLCINDNSLLEVCAAPLEYSFPVDAALKALKFRRRLDYVPAFAELLWRVFQDLPDDIDALLAVPLHWRRHALRGFNQAVELSAVLRQKSGLPLLRNVSRTKATTFQSGLAADARRRNLQQAFAARGEIAARHVLIVDDVITTGETCRQLAKVVLAAGAQKVSVLAVARAVGGPPTGRSYTVGLKA